MRELLKHPQVVGKSTLVFRWEDDPKGPIEVFSYSAFGVESDMALDVRRPDLRERSEDSQWIQSIGLQKHKADISWIVELRGEKPGSKATFRALMKDLWLSQHAVNIPISLVQDSNGIAAAAADVRMRFVVLSNGQLRGCFGQCCASSVEIGSVKIENKWFMQQLVTAGQSLIGSFIPELLGRMLPNLLEVPLKMLLGSEYSNPSLEMVAGGSIIRLNVKIRHNMEKGNLFLKLKPYVGSFDMTWGKASNLAWLPSVSWNSDGMFHVALGDHWTTARLQSFLRPALERCNNGTLASADCNSYVSVPVSLVLDPSNDLCEFNMDGLRISSSADDIMFAVNHAVAQPEFSSRREKNVCLADVDKGRPAAGIPSRSYEDYQPLARAPRFGIPFDLGRVLRMAQGMVDVTISRVGTQHKVSFGTQMQVDVSLQSLLTPFLNDAALLTLAFSISVDEAFFRTVELGSLAAKKPRKYKRWPCAAAGSSSTARSPWI
eukprot:TRINITY_DN5863_c0_g2_i2.p1 TRINITY_DN5863_c0_g2~~TRINITY_DN5863_c0_g2_i2.p1  ORF type:complete len:490 (+),score=61.60 TRINITY_DN5863_c0_g2_i2:1047-2516(+)